MFIGKITHLAIRGLIGHWYDYVYFWNYSFSIVGLHSRSISTTALVVQQRRGPPSAAAIRRANRAAAAVTRQPAPLPSVGPSVGAAAVSPRSRHLLGHPRRLRRDSPPRAAAIRRPYAPPSFGPSAVPPPLARVGTQPCPRFRGAAAVLGRGTDPGWPRDRLAIGNGCASHRCPFRSEKGNRGSAVVQLQVICSIGDMLQASRVSWREKKIR
ncbi:hypothetical protein ACP70R_014547 [Stipagrostis hirtigluma subsp. patula]